MNLAKLLGDVDFPAANRERWQALAEKTLAGESFEDALVTRTDDGVRVEPIYGRAVHPSFLPRRRPDAP